MRYIRVILISLLAAAALLLPTAAATAAKTPAGDQTLFSACSQAPNSPVCKDKGTTEDPTLHIINVAANIVATLAGIAAIITIIISGLTMITSAGNQESVTNARKHLVAALIGLAIVVLAWTITRFIIDKLVQ